jgi:hypothetical protein
MNRSTINLVSSSSFFDSLQCSVVYHQLLRSSVAAWSLREVQESIYATASALPRLQLERLAAHANLTRYTCDENEDEQLSAILKDLGDIRAEIRAEEEYRADLRKQGLTRTRWKKAMEDRVSLSGLQDEDEDYTEDLKNARAKREKLADQAKAVAESTGYEISDIYEKYLNSTTIVVNRRLVSLLPDNGLYFANAVADYGGDWPPTLDNLKAYLKNLQADAVTLATDLTKAESAMFGSGKSVSTEMATILMQQIDLSEPPHHRFRSTRNDENRVFNTLQSAKSRVARNQWTINRLKQWISMSEEVPYSTLDRRPVLKNKHTGQKDYTYLMQLMNSPEKSDQATLSAMQGSPTYSYNWAKPDPRLPRVICNYRSDDEIKIPDLNIPLEQQLVKTTIDKPESDEVNAFWKQLQHRPQMTAEDGEDFFTDVSRRMKQGTANNQGNGEGSSTGMRY